MRIYRLAGDNVKEQIFRMRDVFGTHPKYIGVPSWKKYKCETCGHVKDYNTNHWRKFFNERCPVCRKSVTWLCLEDPPEGYDRIANNSPFGQLRKDVNSINAFWHPKVQNGEDIDIGNFSIGERRFNSLESALQYLREVYVDLRKAKLEDARNESLYNGWQNNVTACANFLKKQFKKWEQPELF